MNSQDRIESFVARIEELGGSVVWDDDLVAVMLDGSTATNDDLELLAGFPEIEILSLAGTPVSDEGLRYLEELPNLKTLSLKSTRVTEAGVDRLRKRLPGAKITTEDPPNDTINPFTGKPFDSAE